MPAILHATGFVLAFFGLCISLAFWIPKFFNRPRLKEILGPKYPLVYVVYLANGPFLFALGLLLIMKFR